MTISGNWDIRLAEVFSCLRKMSIRYKCILDITWRVFPEINWLTLMVQGTKQDSAVSTIGDLAVAGRGEVIGLRSIIVLPGGKDFPHTVSLGFDYKDIPSRISLPVDKRIRLKPVTIIFR